VTALLPTGHRQIWLKTKALTMLYRLARQGSPGKTKQLTRI